MMVQDLKLPYICIFKNTLVGGPEINCEEHLFLLNFYH